MPANEFDNNEFLLLELQRGQESAFDYIFRKHYKVLCAFANAYIHDLDKAQSLVQDCFIKFWENRENAGNIKNLSSYLTFMVRNLCLDYLRKIKSMDKVYKGIANQVETHENEDGLLSREFEEKFVKALYAVPERSRVAFEYSRFEELTYKEIAGKMGVSVKAVEALISRALKILRKELKEYLPIIIILIKLKSH
ncbi:RNA polymerase sigma-70 factor [Maribellus maritimus]|uniref:RNA polymerase sigma-70 factor n=1 Tax=Maribellus maritimus TaxID=2870838 RepID=UPI001EEA0C2C|nr:RNA polymerase sigma-70 factor [Maribellus maritimus]MCG6190669.1 RNA polymerase sigma-70 factor [Maribellus maritimus]